jgi:hypothetical protein
MHVRDWLRYERDLATDEQLKSYHIGGLAQGSHLFPSRTEKLSPAAPMVLGLLPGE